MQVLYSPNHWVAVACDGNEVVVADSLGCNITPLVAKQLKELYRHRVDDNGLLTVNIVRCTQQPNTCDCAVFAAAFLF